MLKAKSNLFVLANPAADHDKSGGPGLHLKDSESMGKPDTNSPTRDAVGARLLQAASRRVLVVDDNEDAAQSTAELLRLFGHEVFIAHEGSKALAERARLKPDVVLLDISLPDIDGYEVARRMRGDADQQAMVLVAMTGWGNEEDKQKANDAGFDQHWVKPVSIDKLKDIGALTHRHP
ncbi:response regulator [Noviherbaspirillum saxi]|uniref:Response regulator n=1 Tax=Noviherbaspirillum saxi TaxID=2320863 RepID=A0A3A3FKW0_9BURK|nr:response regulator [Noviherbaspirillum saxi]RJF95361.1 response regulator [Noviherbaspirillum saxi]